MITVTLALKTLHDHSDFGFKNVATVTLALKTLNGHSDFGFKNVAWSQ